MSKEEREPEELDSIDLAFAEGTAIDDAIEEAVYEALLRHRRAGNPIVVWRDGSRHWIPAEEIEAELLKEGRAKA